MNGLNDFAKLIHAGNKSRGFDVASENIGQSLMLVVSELSEALEADRKRRYANLPYFFHDEATGDDFDVAFKKNVKDTFQDEIADAIIRLLDLSAGLNIDIETHIELKLKYNATREYRHGKAY